METVIGVACALVVVFWVFFYLFRDHSAPPPTKPQITIQITGSFSARDPENFKTQNEACEQWLEQKYPDSEKCIFTKVVGVTHTNPDGSNRQTILQRCRTREELRLVPEPDNPYDSNAIAVCRADGQQLGYLNKRLAADLQTWTANGDQWFAVLTKITGTDISGANIALIRRHVLAPK